MPSFENFNNIFQERMAEVKSDIFEIISDEKLSEQICSLINKDASNKNLLRETVSLMKKNNQGNENIKKVLDLIKEKVGNFFMVEYDDVRINL